MSGKDLQLYSQTGKLHTIEWLESNGISTGMSVSAFYQEIRHGSCNPFMITFPTIKDSADAYGG